MRKWNKLLALLLAMSMVLGMATTAFAAEEETAEPVGETTEETETPAPEETPAEEPAAEAGYTDVTEANWYYEAVTYVTENGLVDGATETTFAPSAEMTRAALAVALYRMAGSPEVTAENPFTDVSAEDDYYNAVLWAYTNGIVTGMTETTFGVDSTLQRQQIATMLYRYAENVTAAPADETTEPADETTEPADETTEPADETTEPADETTEPADETTEPADETAEPADETAEPADETAEPADETAEPADETAEPADETAEPADETAEPADETTEPADETAEPADETAEPAEEDVLAQFTDADLVQAYAKEAVIWAVEAGLFTGNAGALNPRGNATRAEVATLLMRFAAMIAPAEAPEDAIGGADAETDIAVTDGEETTEPAEGEAETETEGENA